MRNLTAVLGVVLLVSVAFAGKPERDKQNELKPTITATEGQVKAACGCAAKINVKWETFAKADDMFRIANTLEDITTATKAQCQSADDKKAYCSNVVGYELSYSKGCAASPALKGKTIQLGSDDSCHPGDHQITAIISKF